MDVDDVGNPFDTLDNSGIPELTEEIVVDQDIADPDDDNPDTPRADGGGPNEPGG